MNRSGEEQEKFLHYLEEKAMKKGKRKACSNSQDTKEGKELSLRMGGPFGLPSLLRHLISP